MEQINLHMMTAEIYILIARKLAGEATQKDLQELEALSEASPAIRHYIAVLLDWWNAAAPVDRAKAERSFEQLLDRMGK
jgi:hypothetical protein